MADTNDVLSVTLEIDDTKAVVKLDNFGQKIKIVSDDINKIGNNKQFAGKLITDFDALSKKAEQTHKSLSDISKVRLDNGQIGAFTREIITAQERSKALVADIVSIQRELANPNRKSSISFLANELKGAQSELDGLSRKLNTLPSQGSLGSSGGGAPEKFGKIRGFGAIFREFAPAGVTEGLVNAGLTGIDLLNASLATNAVVATTATAATTAHTAATAAQGTAAAATTTAVEAETTAFAGLTLASFAFAAALAVPAYAIIKVTQSIREEAERRLHVEESIAGIINRQIISQREALANFAQSRKDVEEGKNFQSNLQNSDINSLERQRSDLEARLKITQPKLTVFDEKGKAGLAANKDFDQITEQISAIDDLIRTRRDKQRTDIVDNFRLQNDLQQKSLAQSAEFDRQAQKRRSDENEKAKTKFKELEKLSIGVFDSLYQKTGANNPFVAVFSEADKSLRDLRENIKTLSPELQAVAVRMQQTINGNKLFETRLGNKLNIFDLRDSADAFRNPKDPEADKRRRDEIINNEISGKNSFSLQFGTYGSDYAKGVGGADKLTENQRRDIYEQALIKYGSNIEGNGRFNELNQGSIISRLASDRNINPNLSVQQRLDKQFEIIKNSNPQNEDQISLANRKIISLTQGLNPNQLTDSEREKAAIAREQEAVRLDKSEKDAKKDFTEIKGILSQIVNVLAEKGIKLDPNSAFNISVNATGAVEAAKSELPASPTNKDTQIYYDPDLSFKDKHGFSNR